MKLSPYLGFATILLLLVACGAERPYKPVITDGKRIAKSNLSGTFLYLRSIADVKYHRGTKGQLLAPGVYEDSDKLIQFVIGESSLQVVSVDPLYKEESSAQKNRTLLSFPVRHVDVLRKQNADGEDTHEEEQTESRRVWQDREYLVIDLTKNFVDTLPNVLETTASGMIEISAHEGSILFSTTKNLTDGTVLEERYSFLRFVPSATYTQRAYGRSEQDKFGFFKTTTYAFDKYGRITQANERDYLNRWDTSRPVVYYFSEAFPERLQPAVRASFEHWNRAFLSITGKPLLELRPNSGQKPGDLRYNLVIYNESEVEHGLIGYGPSFSNPRTGEMVKADVYIYGGTLKHAIYSERLWARLLGERNIRQPSEASSLLITPLPSARGLELSPPTLEWLKKTLKAPLSMLASTQEAHRRELAHCFTRLSTETMSLIAAEAVRPTMSDEQLEIQLFQPLIAHELGHNLALRHNFMGSADLPHYGDNAKSSSVMDYGFLSSYEPMAPGPYDTAALRFAYSQDHEEVAKVLNGKYLYCADHQLFDSRYGLCQEFDSGDNLLSVAQSLMRRYTASFYFNNLRLDRAHFPDIDDNYEGKVGLAIARLRLLLDHAATIHEVGAPLLKLKDDLSLKQEALFQLWRLLGSRIEASGTTPSIVSVATSPSTKVILDIEKLHAAIEDAEKAKLALFGNLRSIVVQEVRDDYDKIDPLNHDLQTRGVLIDRILSLIYLAARFPDPLDRGTGTSIYATLHEPFSKLLGDLISNTQQGKSPEGKPIAILRLFDPNLREFATQLVTEMMNRPTLESGEIRELIRLEQVHPTEPDASHLARLTEMREVYKKLLFEAESSEDPIRIAQLRKLIQQNREALHSTSSAEVPSFPVASFAGRDGSVLKAPLNLADFPGLMTATGRLLRDNLNDFEDRRAVVNSLISWLTQRRSLESDTAKKDALTQRLSELNQQQLLMSRYLETERNLVERLHNLYRQH